MNKKNMFFEEFKKELECSYHLFINLQENL